MELSELTVLSFVNLLGSDAPAPGGGSTAALEGSLGAALTAMVSAVTMGRKKYAEYEELAIETNEKASALKEAFLIAMDHDTAVFNEFTEALALPKESPEEKAARSAAMQTALEKCTDSPFRMMLLCIQALELTASILGRSNANAMSDLGVAALSLGAAIRGAWLNVLINVGSLKNEELAAFYKAEGKRLVDRGTALSEELYHKIETALN